MRFSFRFAYRAEQGDGFQPDASRSFLKCELVKNRPLRYRGSWTTVVTINHASPLSSCVPWKYSVRIAFALYGTPFLRRYPGRMPVVTTVSDPPSTGGAPRRPPPPGSQSAIELPCHDRGSDPDFGSDPDECGSAPEIPGARPKWKRRVCVPASVSMRSVVSSCQVMCSRPGTRIIAGAPYERHCSPAASSFAGSHASATRSASALSGTLA